MTDGDFLLIRIFLRRSFFMRKIFSPAFVNLMNEVGSQSDTPYTTV